MPTVLVIYHSQQYGNTKLLAESVAEGIRKAGGQADLVNTNERAIELNEFLAADAIALGTPDYFSYVAGTIKTFFDDLYLWNQAGHSVKGKPSVFFLSHGGGGKAIQPFEALAGRFFRKVGKTFAAPRPISEEAKEKCRELGRELVKELSEKGS
jgi:multimeric flavodoxin WrbA